MIRSEVTFEQENALTHPAPLTDEVSKDMRERIAALDARAEKIIEVGGVQYVVVWDGARPSPWGGYTKGELMPPYRHRKHLTVESKVG